MVPLIVRQHLHAPWPGHAAPRPGSGTTYSTAFDTGSKLYMSGTMSWGWVGKGEGRNGLDPAQVHHFGVGAPEGDKD